MTELYINNQLVDLPTDFKVTLVTENVFFSTASTYTFDVKLPCAPNSNNARILANCNRADKTVNCAPMPARLIVDNRMILNGTAVIVGTENETVSVQLLQGNSELNWKNKYDKVYINELDMGTVDEWGFLKSQGYDPNYLYLHTDLSTTASGKTYWKADCVYNYTNGLVTVSPVINSETAELMNCLSLFDNGDLILHEFADGDYASNVILPTRLAPQPRLWLMVEKVFTAAGLTIGKHELRDLDIYNNAFIANSTEVWLIADILPKLTFTEFVEQLQNTYNCVVTINNGRVDILRRDKYYDASNPDTEQVHKVLDEFTREVDASAEVADADKPRQYDISYSEFGKHFLGDDFADVPIYPASKLTTTPNPYVFAFAESGNKVSSPFLLPNGKIDGFVVDYFRASDSPKGADKTTLEIVPTVPYAAKNVTDVLEGYYSADWRDITPLIEALAAQSSGVDSLIEGRENIQELINAGETPSAKGNTDKLPISYLCPCNIFDNHRELWNWTFYLLTAVALPSRSTSYTTYFTGNVPTSRRQYYTNVGLSGNRYDMSLFAATDDYIINYFKALYKEKTTLSLASQYNFKFAINRLFNVEKVFLIRNQRYAASQIKYTIDAKGFQPIAEGTFYKL